VGLNPNVLFVYAAAAGLITYRRPMTTNQTSAPPSTQPASKLFIRGPIVVCRVVNGVVTMLLLAWFFLAPAVIVIKNLNDPKIRTGGIPYAAWKLHRTLSPKYAQWAKDRVASDRGLELSTANISGTEWPLFGSVFYLWSTEALQEAWEKDPVTMEAPNLYAHEAIESAAALVIDPKQAGWVQKHYGATYLTNNNAFYRMLVISALTSHARLTGSKEHLDLLRSQVDTLSDEIAATPHGLLEDYPGECYPGDVVTAIAMIRKADGVLGTDHSAFCAQAIRGFQGDRTDKLGLIPYAADARRGSAIGWSRGCGNSYVSLFSPSIWPEQAKRWYELYEKHFWQQGSVMVGFREFSKELAGQQWYFDVDSGPVIGGIGFAASAFGVGAARVNGRLDHAYPLTAEMYVTSWPLPDGTLVLPRLLSNAADAPYLGEAANLFSLTRSPETGFRIQTGGTIPKFVVIVIAAQILIGLGGTIWCIVSLRRWLRNRPNMVILEATNQFRFWLALLFGSLALLLLSKTLFAFILLLSAQFFPRGRKLRQPASH
jgi:hypothetical protein